MNPQDPIPHPVAAAAHPDPYPYYAQLRGGPPLAYNEPLRLWVASRAEVVMEVLGHPALRVRPPAEPVPRAMVGTPAGELFSQLVRMNDGPLHAAHRPVLQRALAGVKLDAAHRLALQVAGGIDTASLDDFCLAMPVSAVAALLGFDSAQLPALARWTRDFVACLSPLSSEAQLQASSAAASTLLQRFERLMEAPRPGSALAAVCNEARQAPAVQRRVLLSNLVGFLSQTCEATAGLVGNSVVALRREPGLYEDWLAGQSQATDIVAEVARHDPSVQNTRRFVAEPATVAGTRLAAGDGILVLLGSAHRDPALNRMPDRFDLARTDRRLLGFGHGVHACPGQALAQTIAAAGLQALRDTRLRTRQALPAQWRYRPSANGRMPVFSAQAHG
ncbi:cytochrome P450 [Variovorax sp. LARHSF232]